MAIIYKITHKETGKSYIGASRQSLARVKIMHKNLSKKYNGCYSPSINWAIKQEGIRAFYWQVIHDNIPVKDLDYWEEHYIALHNTFHEGYNTTVDGRPHSAYETQLMREGKWNKLGIAPHIKNLYRWYLNGVVDE